jgi:hypothetical protein
MRRVHKYKKNSNPNYSNSRAYSTCSRRAARSSARAACRSMISWWCFLPVGSIISKAAMRASYEVRECNTGLYCGNNCCKTVERPTFSDTRPSRVWVCSLMMRSSCSAIVWIWLTMVAFCTITPAPCKSVLFPKVAAEPAADSPAVLPWRCCCPPLWPRAP